MSWPGSVTVFQCTQYNRYSIIGNVIKLGISSAGSLVMHRICVVTDRVYHRLTPSLPSLCREAFRKNEKKRKTKKGVAENLWNKSETGQGGGGTRKISLVA